jgi:cytochrome c oxidase subunit 4
MSSSVSTATGHATDVGHHESRFHLYVQIAMILAVITGIEVVAVFVPFPPLVVITVLGVLSVVKFMFVIFYFMHLRWDKIFCTILFFIGLILGGGTLIALITLFRMHASIPLTFSNP